jgi:hypothetical protein
MRVSGKLTTDGHGSSPTDFETLVNHEAHQERIAESSDIKDTCGETA